jgi:HAD superfamily phosphatase (TIGR01668 family)
MIKRVASLSQLNQKTFIDLGCSHALLLIDIDNTLLSPYDQRISPQEIQWIKNAQVDHQILLCTNNFTKRQSNVGVDLNLPILMRSFKPFPFKVRAYLKRQNVDMNSVVIIGDQAVTDVLLALWLGRPYLLIKPMDVDKHWITRFFRILESKVIHDE